MDPKLNERYSSLTSELDTLLTQRPGLQMPTSSEVNTEQQLKKSLAQLKQQQDTELSNRWYGDSSKQEYKEDSGDQPKGLLQGAIDALSTPIRAVVGGIDYATGKSRGLSLMDAMEKNISEDKRLFGDVLKPYLGKASAPVGLAADIILDPVNIVTAGTGGIIGRMLAGGTKGFNRSGLSGALKGIRYGAESRALEAALTMRNLTLGGTKLASKVINRVKNPTLRGAARKERLSELDIALPSRFIKSLEDRSVAATKKFDDIIGESAIERAVRDDAVGSVFYKSMEKAMKKVGDAVPAAREFFNRYFLYDPEGWTRTARLRDALFAHSSNKEMDDAAKAFIKVYDQGGTADEAFSAMNASINQMAKRAVAEPPFENSPFETAISPVTDPKTKEEIEKLTSALLNRTNASAEELIDAYKVYEDSDEAVKIIAKPETYITHDPNEIMSRLFAEGTSKADAYHSLAKSLERMVKTSDPNATGVEWWDNMKIRVNEFREAVNTKKSLSDPNITIKERVGQRVAQFLNMYDTMSSFFKRSAVAASARAWTNAVLGNLAMAKVNGIDVLDPLYMKSFRQAYNTVLGKTPAELLLNDLASVSDLIPMAKLNPTQFEMTTGLSPFEMDRIAQLRGLMGRFKQTGVDAGVLSSSATDSEVLNVMEDILRAASDAAGTNDDALFDAATALAKQNKVKTTTANKRIIESIDRESGLPTVDAATDVITNEFYDSTTANKALRWFAEKAKEEGNYTAKFGDLIFNKMPSGYSKIDHIYKLSNIVYTTKYGLKESELHQVARAIDLGLEEVEAIVSGGVSRYKLSAAKSFELANETFLNYNAMPPAVKLIRQLPFVGAPFISFTYGMGNKIAKSLLKNPAFYTKQSFALQEMSADPSPVERSLLAMDRYKYLNDPSMVKLPFPGNSMIYVNAANVLPYLSLSLLSPTNRSYDEALPNAVAQAVDRSPFVKDPIGSIIFDYFVMPALLSEEIPLGSFGQPVLPQNATAAERALYPLRSFADAMTPGVLQQVAGTLAPESTAEILPGYLTRKIINSKYGQTPLGISSKEPATSRFLRAQLSGLGIPIQTPVPHAYLDEEEIKDKLDQ